MKRRQRQVYVPAALGAAEAKHLLTGNCHGGCQVCYELPVKNPEIPFINYKLAKIMWDLFHKQLADQWQRMLAEKKFDPMPCFAAMLFTDIETQPEVAEIDDAEWTLEQHSFFADMLQWLPVAGICKMKQEEE